jgi:hypothetical protein
MFRLDLKKCYQAVICCEKNGTGAFCTHDMERVHGIPSQCDAIMHPGEYIFIDEYLFPCNGNNLFHPKPFPDIRNLRDLFGNGLARYQSEFLRGTATDNLLNRSYFQTDTSPCLIVERPAQATDIQVDF